MLAAAASKLADAGNYSWKSTMDLGPNSQFTPGPTEGKIDKDGTLGFPSPLTITPPKPSKRATKSPSKAKTAGNQAPRPPAVVEVAEEGSTRRA